MKIKMRKKGMRKKGLFYNIGLVFVIFTILTSAFFILEGKKEKFDGKIGEQQFELVKGYQNIEFNSYYVKRILLNRLISSIKNVGVNGGFGEKKSECGYQADSQLSLWSMPDGDLTKVKTCFPFEDDDHAKVLKYYFNQNWNTGLRSLEIAGKLMPSTPEKTQLIVNDNEVKFLYKANEKVEFLIGKNKNEDSTEDSVSLKGDKYGKYYYNPSLKFTVPYSFEIYDQVKELAQKIIDDCGKSDNVRNCVYSTKHNDLQFFGQDCKEVDVSRSIFENRFFPVCVKGQNLVFAFADIRFVLFVPESREPDFSDFFLDGILDFNLDFANFGLFNIGSVDLFELSGLNVEWPTSYTSINSNSNQFVLPQAWETGNYNYGFRFNTDQGEFEYEIRVSNGKIEIIK